jgi:hypothetical protein
MVIENRNESPSDSPLAKTVSAKKNNFNSFSCNRFNMINHLSNYLILTAGLVALTSCGAPNKSAGEVAHLFESGSESLQSKENSLCSQLQTRDTAPTLKGLRIDLDGCKDAGLAALDYKKVDGFHFIGLDGDINSKDEKIIRRSVRSQIWLNKSLLGFASAISNQMKKKAERGDNTGEVKLDDSAVGKLQNIAKTKITVIKEPKFDLENFSFNALINFNISGIITGDHDIEVDGKLIDNMFAVTIKTTEDRTFKQSLIQNFTAVILIVPHASDLYMDMFVDLNIHNPGLDTVVKDQIDTFLGTGLKAVIDSLMAL